MSIRSKPVHLIRFFCSSCQDLPLGHCGIISLVGHLRGERAVVRRSLLLKGGFNKELLLLQPSQKEHTLFNMEGGGTLFRGLPRSLPHTFLLLSTLSFGGHGGCPPWIGLALVTSSCELSQL